VVITTLADHGVLYYNGQPVTTNQQIDNYDPALMQIKFTGSGYNSVKFQYAYLDQAGAVSPPVDYTITWGSPLPVTLVSFKAKAVENAVELSWVTTSETNSDRFQVQRSQDGKAWTVLGDVTAKGESKASENYAYTDRQPAAGNNLYRLKMIDRDGSFAFSSISSVNVGTRFESSIYPNPVADKLNIKVSDWKKVKEVGIYDLKGLKVYRSENTPSALIDITNLIPGMYIIRIIETDGSEHNHKMIHIK